MSKTVEMLKRYVPYNEQEKEDIAIIVKAEEIFGDILNRTNQYTSRKMKIAVLLG